MPTKLSTGTLLLPSTQLDRLATSHPFVQRIDVVSPSRLHQFASLKTTYSTAHFALSDLYEYASHLPISTAPFKALPIRCNTDDTWCIDPRGILTLCISKCLYDKLGVVGKKLPFKGCPERYVIHIPLKRETMSVAVQARHRTALGIWDRDRAERGLGKWHVAYVGATGSSCASVDGLDAYTAKDVTACVRHQAVVHVPRVGSLDKSTEEDEEDHEERLEALFEWVGMACLGAQRLHANDRVDPYVAVYEAPSPASIDDITHLSWRGLMDSTFVRSVIDTAVSILATSESTGDDNPFVSVTLHSNLGTPVSYIPESLEKEAPPRVPGPDGEDTSIGKWDGRWG